MSQYNSSIPRGGIWDKLRRRLLVRALRKTEGNRTRAAQYLGVSIRTVRIWIREFELAEDFPASSVPGQPRCQGFCAYGGQPMPWRRKCRCCGNLEPWASEGAT